MNHERLMAYRIQIIAIVGRRAGMSDLPEHGGYVPPMIGPVIDHMLNIIQAAGSKSSGRIDGVQILVLFDKQPEACSQIVH